VHIQAGLLMLIFMETNYDLGARIVLFHIRKTACASVIALCASVVYDMKRLQGAREIAAGDSGLPLLGRTPLEDGRTTPNTNL
jgi:hypothetical protein